MKNYAERIAAARNLIAACRLCPRRCRVNRLAGESGYCGAGAVAWYFDTAIHYGDELTLIPNFALSLGGCNLRCCYCITAPAAWQAQSGQQLDIQEMVGRVQREKLRILHLVGGEPAVHLPAILELAQWIPDSVRILLDSNFYFAPEVLPLVQDVVSDFLPDLKFGNDACAARLSQAKEYWQTVTSNILAARSLGNVIVRHLLLPGHFACCFMPIIEWLSQHCRDVPFSLRCQFVPPASSPVAKELAHFIGADEYGKALTIAKRKGLNLVQ
jgi:putative pyruvate formate lyase activating enzyme